MGRKLNINDDIAKQVKELEELMEPSFGAPIGDELPQIATADEIALGLIHTRTGKPIDLIDAELHHQMDPSYKPRKVL